MTNQRFDNFTLIAAGNDIYYIEDFENISTPSTVQINNKEYHRFCDFIYIPLPTDKMTPEQVITANAIRTKYFERSPQFKINTTVRKKFKSLINFLKPKSILEIGTNLSPLIENPNDEIEIIYNADFDVNVIKQLTERGINAQYFGIDSSLNIKNESIDLIFSIFVFQFDFSNKQIEECYRTLCNNGMLIANVYKRSDESKKDLKTVFEAVGFKSSIYKDFQKLCDGHEYWFFYKRLNSEKMAAIVKILSNQNL